MANLILDPSFELTESPVWTFGVNTSRSSEQAYSGTYSAKFTTNSTQVIQTIASSNFISGAVYTLSAWVYFPNGAGQANFRIEAGAHAQGATGFAISQGVWTFISATFTATVDWTTNNVEVWVRNIVSFPDIMYADIVSFELTSMPYYYPGEDISELLPGIDVNTITGLLEKHGHKIKMPRGAGKPIPIIIGTVTAEGHFIPAKVSSEGYLVIKEG